MRVLWLLCVVFLLGAGPVAAQQINVRSGEHENFSRLVFMLPPGTAWTTEQVPGGIRLTTPSRTLRFNTASVFDLIPKTRVLAVTPDLATGSIFIETAEAVHLESFQLPIGAVVLDFVDGPASALPAAPATRDTTHIPAPDLGYLDLYWSGHDKALPPPAGPRSEPPPAAAALAPVAAIAIPDPRIQSAESDLVDQLGRAASQGLITMELPRSRTARPQPEPAPNTEEAPAPPAAVDDQLALQSETVIDRDTASSNLDLRLTEAGHSCPPDSDYDLLGWLGDKTPTGLIADARRDLVGEFDRPRMDAVRHLVEAYLALGFGAEAKAVLRAFPVDAKEVENFSLIADVVDGNPVAASENLSALTSCDGKAALWSVLALPQTPPKDSVNFGAVLRAYSALPPNLRERVGPALSSRLIDMGAADLATTVRSMLARAPVDHQSALDVIDAQIDLHKGLAKEATERLDAVAQKQSPVAAESLALSLETKISLGEAIAASEVENAGALAMQLKETALGTRLQRVEVLGLASTGQFDSAFDALNRWPETNFLPVGQQTRNELLEALVKAPEDRFFIETFFRHRDRMDPAAIAPAVQVQLADRLSKAGFWKSARESLSPETRRTDAGRLALARAALAGRDASAAFSHLIGLTGDQASTLRGEALSLLGRHDSAQGEFAQAGEAQAQVEEAWRSGNWSLVAQRGSENQKRFVALFGAQDAATDGTTAALGPLGQAEQLIAQSQSEREAFAKIMEDLTPK